MKNENKKENETDSMLQDVEPYGEAIDGVSLLQELSDTLRKYVYLPEGAETVIPFWILHTYLSKEYNFTPRLFIYSPEPRCGKTTLLDILEQLCYKSMAVSGITGAAMKRIIEQEPNITLLIDEADRYLNDNNNNLCQIINCGYQLGKVVACVDSNGKKLEARWFKCFAPCAIAAIGNIPHTIIDRSIVIKMERKRAIDIISKLRIRDFGDIALQLRQKCKRFIMDNQADILKARPDLPDALNDRTADVSEILFSIADSVSPEWHDKLEKAILTLVKKQFDEDAVSVKTQLLMDIKTIFNDVPRGWLSSNDLVEKLNEIETSPWSECNKGRPLTPASLAWRLKSFNIRPRQSRENYDDRSRKYYVSDFQNAFDRYIPVSSCDTVTTDANTGTNCHTVTVQNSISQELENLDIPF